MVAVFFCGRARVQPKRGFSAPLRNRRFIAEHIAASHPARKSTRGLACRISAACTKRRCGHPIGRASQYFFTACVALCESYKGPRFAPMESSRCTCKRRMYRGGKFRTPMNETKGEFGGQVKSAVTRSFATGAEQA